MASLRIWADGGLTSSANSTGTPSDTIADMGGSLGAMCGSLRLADQAQPRSVGIQSRSSSE